MNITILARSPPAGFFLCPKSSNKQGEELMNDILRFLQNYSAVLITTETNLQYELYLTGLESRILARTARTGKRVPWEVAVDAN